MPAAAIAYGQKLSERELAVLASTAHGRTTEETAARLGLNKETIRTYLRTAYLKLGARNRAHAVTIAFVKGYLKLPATVEDAEAVPDES